MSESSQQKQLFPNMSPRAWEHPADQAALAALQRIPGVDMLLPKLLGATSEPAFRLIHLASAVRVSPRQFTHLYNLTQEACRILDAPAVPELYVAQQPFFNAGTLGVERPFIVLDAAFLETLTEGETLCVIGQELAHCLSGHALYKTLLQILLKLSLPALQVPLSGAALFPILMALMEWNRKSALSADRAGLLVTQDPVVSYSLLMKMAGGPRAPQMDVNEFFAQAAEYDSADDLLTSTQKWLHMIFVSHPFPVIRLTELQSWVDGGHYGRILSQHYATRADDPESGRGDRRNPFERVAENYTDQVNATKDTFADAMSEFMTNVDAFAQQAKHGLESWFDLKGLGFSQAPAPASSEPAPTEAPVPPAEAESDVFDMLVKLRDLQNKGVITAAEFEAQKAKLLSRL